MLRRLGSLFRRRRLERELDDEVRLHLDLLESEHRAHGLNADEARLAALRDFGGVTQIKETYRDRRGLPFLETLEQDVHLGVRSLRRNAGMTVTVILTLMLAIGANTALFSVIYAVLLKPLPYRAPDRLVWIAEHFRFNEQETELINARHLDLWRKQARSFESLAVILSADVTLSGDPAMTVRAVAISEPLGPMFGVTPVLGRDFRPKEFEEAPYGPFGVSATETPPAGGVALLSDHLFRLRFGGDPRALGETIVIRNVPYRVIGVLPANFRFPLEPTAKYGMGTQAEPDVFLNVTSSNLRPTGGSVLGRLKPGVHLETARTELETIQSEAQSADAKSNVIPTRLDIAPLRDHIASGSRRGLLVLWGAVAFVLLIACVNVANLMLMRSAARRRENAIRSALGASRGRLIRSTLTESLLLAFVGGAAGVLLAGWAVRVLAHGSPIEVPRIKDASINGSVLRFSAGVCALAGILSGVLPSLTSSRAKPAEALRESTKSASSSVGRRRLQNLLVIAELALAVALLAGAGLTLHSLWQARIEIGASLPDQVLVSRIEPYNPEITGRPADRHRFSSELIGRIEALPGVRAAAFANRSVFFSTIHISGVPAMKGVGAVGIVATSHYLAAADVKLLAGRWFNNKDGAGSPPIAVVNEAMVREFPAELPRLDSILGRTVPGIATNGSDGPATIVGVVDDFRAPPAVPEPEIFYPDAQRPSGGGDLLVRTSSDPMALAGAIRKIVGQTPRVNMVGAQTLDDQLSSALSPRRLQAALLGTFAAVALLLAAFGIYGVLSYSVAQRIHEIGVRMALGAGDREVLRMVLADGARLTALGGLLGLAAAAALTRLMSSLLYGVSPTDPWTYATVCALLSAVALLAAYFPARRAVRADPIAALRCE
jgi:putative ABC transport system permease protein